MLSAYEPKLYIMVFYMIPDEMMLDFYMLSPKMMNRVLAKTYGTSVVTMNGDAF